MLIETKTEGKLYFRDIITNEKVIKEINTDKEVTKFEINIVDKDSDIANKLFSALSDNSLVVINYETEVED